MSGENFREEAVLAAVKPLRAAISMAESNQPVAFGRVSAEDSTSLEDLFQRHHDRIFRTAHRVTGSAADAEDVLQTVFLRVARGQESAGIVENPESYFARAAINASLDLLRSRKRARAVGIDEVENRASVAVFISKQNPETHHEDRELRKLVRGAVAKLAPTAAQMFALRYFEGYSNGEIARMMRTSALVVGVTLHRARARLRKDIGNYLQKHTS